MIYSFEYYDRTCPYCNDLAQSVISSSDRFRDMSAQEIYDALEREQQEFKGPLEAFEVQLHKRIGSKCKHVWFVGLETPEEHEYVD